MTLDLATAVKARLPLVSITYDDPINVRSVIEKVTGKKLLVIPSPSVAVGTDYVYYTEDSAVVTTALYERFSAGNTTCVVINPKAPSTIVFEAGVLPTPDVFYESFLNELVPKTAIPALIAGLRGLSVKSAHEVVLLASTTGVITPVSVRKVRQTMSGAHQGLAPLDTTYDFYEWPDALKAWVELNSFYFKNPDVPAKLVPRGILLTGAAGVGKSMAAKVLANHFDIPLFRLDLSSSLNKFLGVSERNIEQSFAIIEQNAPCVWLLDEVEKLFIGQEDGTTRRILSQMLWWLQNHKSRVLTVMTTNDFQAIPKELYREERVDRIIHVEPLGIPAARVFARKAYEAMLGQMPLRRQKTIFDAILDENSGVITHARVRMIVYDLIKEHKWLPVLQSIADPKKVEITA